MHPGKPERYGEILKFRHEPKIYVDHARRVEFNKISVLVIEALNSSDIKINSLCLKPKIDSPFEDCTSMERTPLNVEEFFF